MGSLESTTLDITAMYKLTILCLALAIVAAEGPRYAKLQKVHPEPYCSMTEVLACVGEIEAAWEHCWDSMDIMTCIEGVMGASDCYRCACDVLEWLMLYTCEGK